MSILSTLKAKIFAIQAISFVLILSAIGFGLFYLYSMSESGKERAGRSG